MSALRFVHCADLHLDTPFRGLASVSADVASELAEATFRSWDNIVDLTLAQEADFLVVAGDVFDGAERSLRAQLRFRDGLQRLADQGIPSFVAFGNHDPLDGWSHTLDWPDLVHRFGGEPEACDITRSGRRIAAVHGVSHEREAITEDLSAGFGSPDPSVPSVAVLHADVGGDPAHAPYAPTSVERLASKGFTYWALGHVHARRVLRAYAPAVAYPGCAQSRNPRETGAKGCLVVTLGDGAPPDVRFVATDAIRYGRAAVDVSDCGSLDAVSRAVLGACRDLAAGAEGRGVVARIDLVGRNALRSELAHGQALADLVEALRAELSTGSPWIWLERLASSVRGAWELDRLRLDRDLSGDIVRAYDAVLAADAQQLARWRAEVESDLVGWGGRGLLPELTDGELRQLLAEALQQTLDLTVGDD